MFYVEQFDRLQAEHDNFQWFVALSEPTPEDQWTGKTGYVHQVLYEDYLRDHPAPENCEYYVCGPPMMMRAVLKMLDNLGVDFPGTDFPAAAEALGGVGLLVQDEATLEKELATAFTRDTFTLLACVIGRKAYDGAF